MSKELPYFRFYPDEYLNGDITFEDYATQGVFNLICCYYWKSDCEITMQKLCKRIANADAEIKQLISSGILKYNASTDSIKINFLHTQFQPLISKSKKCSKAANIRWSKDRDIMQTHSKRIANADANKDKDKDKEETLHELQKFVLSNCPNICKLTNQLTFEQAEKITQKYDSESIRNVLAGMENKKDLSKKYTSVYLTMLNWLKLRSKDEK